MGRYSWIIVVAIIVWQVIASAMQNAARKKQAEQQAAARARARATGGPSNIKTSTAAAPTQVARGQDLAARRKAQLEELRRRRQTRVEGVPGQTQVRQPSAPTTPQPSPVAQRPAAPARATRPLSPKPKPQPQVTAVAADYGALRASEDAERRRRVTARDKAIAAEVAHERRREKEVRKKPERTTEAPDAYSITSGQQSSADRIGSLLSSPSALRDAFVLKELLEPPLALREDPPGFGA